MRRAIPSAITLLGVCCGAVAIVWAPEHPYWACNAIIAASLCDMLDGRLARVLDATSAIGEQLDSLADVISFGLAPAMVVFHAALSDTPDVLGLPVGLLPALGLLACGAFRLARFNASVDEVSSDHFEGIPIPVGALLVATVVMTGIELELPTMLSPAVAAPVAVGAGLLMVSSVPFPSYKKFRRRWHQVAFFGSMVGGVTMLFLHLPGGTLLLGVMSTYVVLGLGGSIARRERGPDGESIQ